MTLHLPVRPVRREMPASGLAPEPCHGMSLQRTAPVIVGQPLTHACLKPLRHCHGSGLCLGCSGCRQPSQGWGCWKTRLHSSAGWAGGDGSDLASASGELLQGHVMLTAAVSPEMGSGTFKPRQ